MELGPLPRQTHDLVYIVNQTVIKPHFGILLDDRHDLFRRRDRFQFLFEPIVDVMLLAMQLEDFSFFGPTCDDADFMQGPFPLPGDIQAGDYIEIGMLGAYGAAMKTGFNGFGDAEQVLVADEPMASLYDGSRERPVADNVVSLR